MHCGDEMVMREKTIGNAAIGWEGKFAEHATKMLDASANMATKVLSDSFSRLGYTYLSRESALSSVPYRHETSHYHVTRMRVDAEQSRTGITEGIANFKEKIKEAVCDMRLSAEAQDWGVDAFDRMMFAVGKDVHIHVKELQGSLRRHAARFKDADTYEALVGFAAMLKNDIVVVTDGMSTHLERIARDALLTDSLRKN